ncbi:S8 family serine peptidase [Castellaniella sp.]|uniref:S8 family serine peptidase n=1 Tax=Castellaniella sp. TaxID=1955812 RepID=UPI002AFFCD29|nr:S8 family serine peptidase [Castellaniella sp.]
MKKTLVCAASLLTLFLVGCDSSGGSDDKPKNPDAACLESGEYACQTGATEPLYPFQWALNYADSYFKDYPDVFGGGVDLNVEPVHRQGIKGQGVRVMVVDSGVDLHNPDLAPNADFGMSHNLVDGTNDPYPQAGSPRSDPHGTNVAGMIAAAQNGQGVMGIAPLATLGGVNYLENQGAANMAAALGGASWSSPADIFNGSYGNSMGLLPYDSPSDYQTPIIRSMKKLRDGKGAIFLKAAGNDFDGDYCSQSGVAYYDCSNPANDASGSREPNAVVVAAINAFGESSNYSSVGSVIWVSGMGGEYGSGGTYGEVATGPYSGPTIFTTDMRGCGVGYSKTGERTAFLRGESQRNGVPDNPDCDYSYMNGTSAATPTLAGVAALILSANPDLSWRDVRDILRLSARKVDVDYTQGSPDPAGQIPYGALMNLQTNQLQPRLGTKQDIRVGSTAVPIDLGWQINGAGNEHSNWYGFGVPDAERAVALAQEYKNGTRQSKRQDIKIPAFQNIGFWHLGDDYLGYAPDSGVPLQSQPFPYRQVSLLASWQSSDQIVDSVQLRLSGKNVCLGSLGLAVKSPAGTVSLLKLANDHYAFFGTDAFVAYGLSSVSFYGEQARGEWQVFLMAANPEILPQPFESKDDSGQTVENRPAPCVPGTQPDAAYAFLAEARIIAQ